MVRVEFYTSIQKPEATALDWIHNRTPENSVLVADHLYGWWLSGIGERTTLSAAGLEFLIYSHELEVAKSARLLLDTDYYIDNGLIQVREDGPYFLRHNPCFSIETWSGESYSMLNFQDNGTIFFYYKIDNYGKRAYGNTTLADMKLIEAPILSKDENSANLTITRESDLFTVNKTLTVQRGVRFAELSYEIKTKNVQTNIFNIWVPIYTIEGNVTIDQSMTMFGIYDPAQKVCGQVIFNEDLPVEINQRESPSRVEMLYRYPWKRNINIKILVGVFDAKKLSYPDQVIDKYDELVNSTLKNVNLEPLITWDYTKMIEEYDVSYVVCRDQRIYSKFSEDPKFRMVFNGGNVAVFQAIK